MPPHFDQSVAASTAGLLALAVLLSLPIWTQPPTLDGPLGPQLSSSSTGESILEGPTMREPMALDPVEFGTAAEQTGRSLLVGGAVDLLIIEDVVPSRRSRRATRKKRGPRDGAIRALRHLETPILQ